MMSKIGRSSGRSAIYSFSELGGQVTKRLVKWVGFKHMDPKYADAFASGASIQLATFEHYRGLEFARRDEMEGTVRYHVDHTSHPEDNPGWRVVGPIVESMSGENARIEMFNTTIQTSLPPAYLFCCSWEPDQQLIAEGMAVFEIADLRTFGKRLLRDNPRKLGRMHVGEVSYVPRTGNPFAGATPPEGPFFKDPKFASENELRLVFEAAPDPPPEPVIRIGSPLAARLLRRIA
jgi:hypothetical protein